MKVLSLSIALVVTLTAVGCGNTRPGVSTVSSVPRILLARPLPVARRMSLRAARAAMNFPVPEPNVAAASPNNLTSVWADSKSRQVALVYGAGAVTVMMTRAVYNDPQTEFTRFSRENHGQARLGSVDGHVALVISPHSDVRRSNPAWVELDEEGVDVNVVSATQGTAVLLRVAESLVRGRRP